MHNGFLGAGVNRLSNVLEEMTGKRPNVVFRVCWLVITPVLVTVSWRGHEDSFSYGLYVFVMHNDSTVSLE